MNLALSVPSSPVLQTGPWAQASLVGSSEQSGGCSLPGGLSLADKSSDLVNSDLSHHHHGSLHGDA